MKMSNTLQEKNKALIVEGFNTLFNQRDFTAAEKYWSPGYIQHSAHIEPGRDGLFKLVKSLPVGAKWEHGIMMAEGDYVMLHSRYTNPDGPALVVMDIMRIENGLFKEHWDVMQSEASKEESKSKLPMFGDSFPR
jgi:predicted SnoaL-like aldol condensation-catalyzing enzyme